MAKHSFRHIIILIQQSQIQVERFLQIMATEQQRKLLFPPARTRVEGLSEHRDLNKLSLMNLPLFRFRLTRRLNVRTN